jgi:uncharacterized lipoprotein YddW (UPF0748 family)
VWIATVANIDWPKNNSQPWADQKKSYLELLDYYKALHFNAVIVQVRTAGDALYPSDKAPWSRYLSGTEGTPPNTRDDPLDWLIREAHLRGMQFHAWLNPYRATMGPDTLSLAPGHDFYRHRHWMLPYGTRYYYNPGEPGVRKHLESIILEIINNYEVDGIHFDDYFYPYKIAGEVFEDSLTYAAHALPGTSLEDWRRSNIDSLVQQIHATIKRQKPWVRFGISPFGVWRNIDTDPEGSDTRAGQTTYDDLYADPIKWMHEGWIDYIVPQLYWSMDYPPASYRKLLSWWAEHGTETHLYIGNAIYKIRNNDDVAWEDKRELPRQLSLARNTTAVKGNIFFSAKSLLEHPDVAKTLRKKYFRFPAMPPESSPATLDQFEAPHIKSVTDENQFYQVRLNSLVPGQWQYAFVYSARRENKINVDNPAQLIAKIYLDDRYTFTLGKNLAGRKKILALTFLDVYGRESQPIILHLKQTKEDDPER